MTKTEQHILDGLHCTDRLWEKVSQDLSKITIRKLPIKKKETSSNYVIYYDGIFTGVFVKEHYIDPEELKQLPWKFEGTIDLFA